VEGEKSGVRQRKWHKFEKYDDFLVIAITLLLA
jgi:hypothetical protein